MNVKVLLALAITFCIFNTVPKPPTVPSTLTGITLAIAGEMSVGLVIGLLSTLVVAGIQLGAHLISQQMGLSLATIYDPHFDDQSTVIEQLAFWLAIIAFFAIGGHREMINALVFSYEKVPMGGGGIDSEQMLRVILGGVESSFHLAIRVGAPALVAFFLASLAMGLLGRSMPQINISQLSITGNLIIGGIMLFIGFTGWAMVSHNAWTDYFDQLDRVLHK
jgi:flagellar biosynthetic protein FliR